MREQRARSAVAFPSPCAAATRRRACGWTGADLGDAQTHVALEMHKECASCFGLSRWGTLHLNSAQNASCT
eukprot:3205315-Rhodomonas_salina.3